MVKVPAHIDTENAQLPVSYQRASREIANCFSLDECKEWSDKSQALASYAKQASDEDLEKTAKRIRARAVYRMGQILKEFQAADRAAFLNKGEARGAGGCPTGEIQSQRQAAEAAGITKHQEKQAVAVAHVPEQTFNEMVEADKPATVVALRKRGDEERDKQEKENKAPPRRRLEPSQRSMDMRAATTLIGATKDYAQALLAIDLESAYRGVHAQEFDALLGNIAIIDQRLEAFEAIYERDEDNGEISQG